MDGIIPLWKERGMTSHDCVFKIRKILRMKKVGHGGTLDPDVDGVLPICVGRATKILDYLQDYGKTYVGEITLGFSTTTEDKSGEVVERKAVAAAVSTEEIDQAMAAFVGTIIQIPPMYSAVKVNGKRLYEYARAGETVERPKRKAQIYTFKRLSEPVYHEADKTMSWQFEVECGKGTYVRTLAVDLGAKLGYPAHMSNLTRLASGGLSAAQSCTLAQIAAKMKQEPQDHSFLQPLEQVFSHFPRVDLSDAEYAKVKNGCEMPRKLTAALSDSADGTPYAFFYQNQLAALYNVHPVKQNYLKMTKMIRNDL